MTEPHSPYRFCRTHGISIGECQHCAAASPQPKVQHFWRCAHYPSAIKNFFAQATCEHGCHTAKLRWFDHGVSQINWG